MAGYVQIPVSPSSSSFPLPPDTPSTASSDQFLIDGEGSERALSEKLDETSRYDSTSAQSTPPPPPRLSRHRRAAYFVPLAFASLLLLYALLATSAPPTPLKLHPTFVAPRPHSAPTGSALYDSCSADEVLASLKTAVIREDGLSRFPDFGPKLETVELPVFEWSWDFGRLQSGKRCAPLKVYTPETACELLSAYSGLFTTGDSFSRHIHAALLMLLRGRNDGAVVDHLTTDDCRQDAAFQDGGGCRGRIYTDTNMQDEVCGGRANLGFIQTYMPDPISFSVFREWRSRLSARSQRLSPIYLTGLGGHFNYEPSSLLANDYLDSIFTTLNHTFPSPLHLFAGPHHPGAQQPEQYVPLQGPKRVEAFAREVPKLLAERDAEKEAYRGAARYVDFFAMTDGAVSYDGVHYSYQVNMEKAMVLLNLLDIIWGQAVTGGGLVDV